MKLYKKIDTTTGLFIEDVLFDSTPLLTETVSQTVSEPIIETDADGNSVVMGYNTFEVPIIQPIIGVDGKAIHDPQYIDTPCPGGFYLPKWDGTHWGEGGTAPEPVPQEPTLEDRTKALEDAMLTLMIGGM